jgi:hypothetical protein
MDFRKLGYGLIASGALMCFGTSPLWANEAGLVKTVKGQVMIEREGGQLPAKPGSTVWVSDKVVSGKDGSVGISLQDGTLLTAGPNSTLVLNKFSYNSTTAKGEIDASLKRGTLSVISGKLSKTSQDAVTYRTPNAILGVRGTEFIIEAE